MQKCRSLSGCGLQDLARFPRKFRLGVAVQCSRVCQKCGRASCLCWQVYLGFRSKEGGLRSNLVLQDKRLVLAMLGMFS